jgi:RNA methyltransferase, TrmH family
MSAGGHALMAEHPDLRRRYREARRDPALAVLEGLHALKHALRFGADVLDVRTRHPDRLVTLARELAPDLAEQVASMAIPVDDATFADFSPAPPATGVIALARRPMVDVEAALADPGPAPVVFLDRPTHHGNIGAVVRVAAAAGAAAVLVSGAHDPWHPSSLRGGAGLQFALPVARIEGLPDTDRPIVALDPEGEPLGGGTPARALFIFGSERGGIDAALLERATQRLAIPMRGGVSSLNLATAVAVTLYHGARG